MSEISGYCRELFGRMTGFEEWKRTIRKFRMISWCESVEGHLESTELVFSSISDEDNHQPSTYRRGEMSWLMSHGSRKDMLFRCMIGIVVPESLMDFDIIVDSFGIEELYG